MSKCNICNCNLGLFSKEKYCNNCKNLIKSKVSRIQSDNIVLNNDLKKKGKKLSYYLEIYTSLIKLQEEVTKTHKIAPDILVDCETNDEYMNRLNNNIINFINEQIEIILEKNSLENNIKDMNKEFKKLYEEVSENKIVFKEFYNVLSKCQENIKEHIIN